MYHKAWDGAAWRPSPLDWERLGGVFAVPPAVAAWGQNRLDIFGLGARTARCITRRGTARRGGHRRSTGSASAESHESAGCRGVGPEAVRRIQARHGRCDVSRTVDRSAWRPSLLELGTLGDVLTSPPAVAAWGNNRLDIFGLGADGAMFSRGVGRCGVAAVTARLGTARRRLHQPARRHGVGPEPARCLRTRYRWRGVPRGVGRRRVASVAAQLGAARRRLHESNRRRGVAARIGSTSRSRYRTAQCTTRRGTVPRGVRRHSTGSASVACSAARRVSRRGGRPPRRFSPRHGRRDVSQGLGRRGLASVDAGLGAARRRLATSP